MDYMKAIEHVYECLENNQVDKSVMICFRIACGLQDFLYAAIFLREMTPDNRECARMLHNNMKSCSEESKKFIYDRSSEYWFQVHTLDFPLSTDDNGEERNVLTTSISEIDHEIEQCKESIADLHVPPGMGEYDTAAFTDSYNNRKSHYRLRITALQTIKQRIKARCLTYVSAIENQLLTQKKSQNFLIHGERTISFAL